MSIAKITLWGKYVYKINYSKGMTIHDMAMAISLEVHRSEHETKFTRVPRTYNYIYECLLRKSCTTFRLNVDNKDNTEKELLKACNDLNNKSEWIKKTDNNGVNYYEHQDYRLGYTQSNTLIIDVDGKDIINISNVKSFYENVLKCKFRVIDTKKGYWLFSDKKYKDIRSWVFDNCRVLNPCLEEWQFDKYRADLLNIDTTEGMGFKRATPEIIKASDFYNAPSNLSLDVAFQFLSIKRERSTIRITKKGKDDSIKEILI